MFAQLARMDGPCPPRIPMSTLEQYRAGIAAYSAGRFEEAIGLLTPLAAGRRSKGKPAAPPDKRGSWLLGGRGMPALFYLGQAHHQLAIQHFEARRFPEATKHFQAAAQINPLGADYTRYLATCYTQSGNYELAVQELSAMLQREPENADTRIKCALAQWKQGNSIDALATLREGLRRQPTHAELHYQVGVMLASEGEMEEAQRLFERTVALDPRHVRGYERLAQCCALVSRSERALAYLQRAHQIDPANPRIAIQLNVLAQSLIAAGQDIKIEWRKTARPQPDPKDIEKLGEAILREPEFVEAFLSLPETEVDSEVFSTLAAVLEQALQKHPEYADLHYHCGAIYKRMGDTDEALRHAEKAVELNGNYVNALILLADLYGRTDRWSAGVERLEQAVQAGANYPDVHYLMGRLFQSGGQLDRARAAYERALELNRDYPAAREALASLAF